MENLMSLNPYVRQLRPRNESYIPPVDKVQGLFEFSVLFETDREEKRLQEKYPQAVIHGIHLEDKKLRIDIRIWRSFLEPKTWENY